MPKLNSFYIIQIETFVKKLKQDPTYKITNLETRPNSN